ncbi:hypothetical protein Tco_0140054 [Tanacetum coccineum]
MKGVGKEMSNYLSNFQFGVGVSGGVEAVLHSINRVLSEYHNDRTLAMLTVDFTNAFNLVDRSTLLYEQDDPLRSLLFALVLHPLVHKIRYNCKLLLHAWYLDDGTLREGIFSVDIRRPYLGVKLLRGTVSRDVDFIIRLAMGIEESRECCLFFESSSTVT